MTLEAFTYHLDLYFESMCWRGELTEPNSRRISDVLNNDSVSSLVLNQSRLITWDEGTFQQVDSLGTVTAVKHNVIAVIVTNLPQPSTPTSDAVRVRKVSRRVEFYAPPLMIVGKFFVAPAVNLLASIHFSHHAFLPLTSASLQWIDARAPLPNSSGLILINQSKIASVRELPDDSGDAAASPRP